MDNCESYMKDIQVCIFDMDGLMIDSERISKEAYERACAEVGVTMLEEMHLNLIGMNANASAKLLQEYFPDISIPLLRERVHEIKEEIYQTEGLHVKKGLHLLLDYLEEAGIKKIVATSTTRSTAINLLERVNIYHRFDHMVFGDEVKESKPAPDIFLKALELASIPAERALVLEDSYNGIRAANSASIPVIMIPDLLPPREDLNTLAVLEDLEKVITYFEQKFVLVNG